MQQKTCAVGSLSSIKMVPTLTKVHVERTKQLAKQQHLQKLLEHNDTVTSILSYYKGVSPLGIEIGIRGDGRGINIIPIYEN